MHQDGRAAASLWQLARDRRVRSRVAAARSPEAGREILEFLVTDGSATVRRAVAARDDPGLLRTLAGDPDLRTRQAVVENPHCPPDVLRRLVAEYDGLEPEIARLLMEDGAREVKESLAAHTALPELLAAMVTHPDLAFRVARQAAEALRR
ncbi:hypothetical protein [Nonomuraea aridisoli]|uniref:HEAT repeat domain-containing protein n=1 Tax=Nonomuraea aridisoli TaxID=2070368 RepID=A0A2W2F5G6_9ACTN|nr:hypothetical protein [Nonomuraea aridisoli]PZG16837.1 hypothetical protein C1J01_19730 [Nonomuraea aridisoli]